MTYAVYVIVVYTRTFVLAKHICDDPCKNQPSLTCLQAALFIIIYTRSYAIDRYIYKPSANKIAEIRFSAFHFSIVYPDMDTLATKRMRI